MQTTLADIAEDTEDYLQFVEKFKPKKTTDDCYTPENVYNAVADWVAKEYGLDRSKFVRPFWPGGDYQSETYPPDCVVVDNPPFSIRSQINRFFMGYGIKFFLFAPTLTLLSGILPGICNIPTGVKITYANGANVNTSFCTNLEPGVLMRSAPDLYQAVKAENDKNEKAMTRTLPKYIYPDNVVTAAIAYHYSQYGIPWELREGDAYFIRELDAQKAAGKSVFGGGYLLSERAAAERAAAERAAAERAAAERWQLSDREWEIVRGLGHGPV